MSYPEPYFPRQVAGQWYICQMIMGNIITLCGPTTHGQPDAEMICDALNAWAKRYSR